MNWADVTKFLGGAAPVVGTLLGGPAGGAVGELISKALGVEDKPDAVIDALKANPDAIIKIKELENSKALAEIQANIEKYRIDADIEKAQIDAGKNIEDNTTQRWLSDNTAGGLPAITRPLLVWWLVISFTLMALFDGNIGDFKIKTQYIDLLNTLLPLALMAYFGLRTYEKKYGVHFDK